MVFRKRLCFFKMTHADLKSGPPQPGPKIRKFTKGFVIESVRQNRRSVFWFFGARLADANEACYGEPFGVTGVVFQKICWV